MFYGNSVQETRQLFFSSWNKYLTKQSLLPLEQQIVTVILDHPEYHNLLESPSAASESTYHPELGLTNPFLHMGLHLAIRDQITMDCPVGIKAVFQQLSAKHADTLTAEHCLMDCLAETLWQAQRDNAAPDESNYLNRCKALLL